MADYTFDFNLNGGVDVGADDIRVKELPLIRFDTIHVKFSNHGYPENHHGKHCRARTR